jgi:hypothetical protein
MTKFIKVSKGLVAANYFNAAQIISVSEISSDDTDYKPILLIKMNRSINKNAYQFTLGISFKEFHEWLNSDLNTSVLLGN